MNEETKLKATDYLTESLKTITAISTIFIGGLIAYQSEEYRISLLFWLSLALFTLSALFSVFCINSIINKVFRGDIESIQKGEVKILTLLSLLTLLGGITTSAFFISEKKQSNDGVEDRKLHLDENKLSINKEFEGTVTLNDEGKIIKIEIKK
jgi:hypothetical protein